MFHSPTVLSGIKGRDGAQNVIRVVCALVIARSSAGLPHFSFPRARSSDGSRAIRGGGFKHWTRPNRPRVRRSRSDRVSEIPGLSL